MTVYNWMCLLGVPTAIAGLVGFIKVQMAQNKAIKLGIQAILRDRLLQGFKYYQSRGWANYDEKNNISNMYQQYEQLGKNGVMQTYYEDFLRLPNETRTAAADESLPLAQ